MKKTEIEKTANTTNKSFVWLYQSILKPLSLFIWNKAIKPSFKGIKKFFKKNPELLTFPITFGIWFGMGVLIKWFRPEEEPFPLIFIQDILFTTMKVAVYISAAWYIFKLIYGTFSDYLLSKGNYKNEDGYKKHFKKLTEWQKILITILVFFAVFYAFVIVG